MTFLLQVDIFVTCEYLDGDAKVLQLAGTIPCAICRGGRIVLALEISLLDRLLDMSFLGYGYFWDGDGVSRCHGLQYAIISSWWPWRQTW